MGARRTSRKARRRERRAAARLGLTVEQYRDHLVTKAARDNNASRRRKRETQSLGRETAR